MRNFVTAVFACLVLAACPAFAQGQTKKIVFLAGPKEHGDPGRHEYEKDLRELAWSLEHASNLKGIRTVVLVGKPPKDLSVFADADEIVIDGNGDWLKTETGILFPQYLNTDGRTYDPETTAWLKALDALIKEKKIGLPEYQLTANVWARAILEDDFGVKPSDVHWIRGGIEHAGRPEKITIKLPDGVRLDSAPEGKTISELLADGAIDGFMAPRPPAIQSENIGWLFRDPVAAAKDYYKRTGIFPIMHLIGVRRTLAEKHPWLPAAVLKAFEQSKAAAMAHLWDTSATKVTMPFIEERIAETRALMGDDYWPYGVESNRKTLDTFLHHHHTQGLSSRRLKAEELFHPGTLESFKI